MRLGLGIGVGAAVLLGLGAVSGAADLPELVKKSDVIVLGQVISITEGELDPDALRRGHKFRTDVARIAVVQVLKGDPALRKVTVGFPGFPKPGQLALERNQEGIWFLTKGDQKHYEARTKDRLVNKKMLGAVRRAVRTAAGLTGKDLKPADRAARIAELCKQLGGDRFTARALAAHKLGDLGALETVPALIHALDDPVATVRLSADIALRKITGRRVHVDFRNGTERTRAPGVAAWKSWWTANKARTRQEILTDAIRLRTQPQPDFHYAIRGLARYPDPSLRATFVQAWDLALSLKDNDLVVAAAEHFGRSKDRTLVPKLARLIDGTFPWQASTSARVAVATAIGHIVKKDFGTGLDAVGNCVKWWAENRDLVP